jgi:hypothetical protein
MYLDSPPASNSTTLNDLYPDKMSAASFDADGCVALLPWDV